MNIAEMLIIISVMLLAGYLLKMFIDKYILTPKDTKQNEAEYQYQIELLQNKFSAEIIKKDEDIKTMQDELKAMEQKNFNLQVQHAKSLKQLEKSKSGRPGGKEDSKDQKHNEYDELLAGLREKTLEQEQTIRDLQTQLQETVNAAGLKESTSNESNELIKSLQEKIAVMEREKQEVEQHLHHLQKEKETGRHEFDYTLKTYTGRVTELETQLSKLKQEAETENTRLHAEKAALQNEIAAFHSRLESAGKTPEPNTDHIRHVRADVEQVASFINNFQQHLNTVLEKTTPYEQVIADNENYKTKLEALEAEKLQVENAAKDELSRIAEEKTKLETKCNKLEMEMTYAQQLIQQLEAEKNTAVSSLQAVTKEKESALYNAEMTQNRLEQTIKSLQIELDEREIRMNELAAKENQYREMLHVVKDLENQFLKLHPQLNKLETEEFITVNKDGEIS